MMPHAAACLCRVCTDVRALSVPVTTADCLLLAGEWETWISTTDGEAAKLRDGQHGAVGSPRWVTLQAIARSRRAR